VPKRLGFLAEFVLALLMYIWWFVLCIYRSLKGEVGGGGHSAWCLFCKRSLGMPNNIA